VTDTTDVQAILGRLAKLEGQNRRLRQAGLAALIALGGLLLMGQAAPIRRTLRAQEFDLVDARGRLRGKLGFDGKDPQLDLYNRNGISTATLYSYDGGNTGGLLLTDIDSGSAISLNTEALVGPQLRFSDKDRAKVALSLWLQTGNVSLDLSDAQGNRSVLGAVARSGLLPASAQPASAASLVMLGKNGQVIYRAP